MARTDLSLVANKHNRYELRRKISCTLQGAVYEACDKLSKKTVAIKVASKSKTPPTEAIQCTHNLENVDNESWILQEVKSDGVIEFFDFFEDVEYKYIVIEYVENGDLFSLLERHGVFSEDLAKRFFLDLVMALKDLHDLRVCHLDLSLENVLVTEESKLKLCDFGVARIQEGNCISSCGGEFRPGKLMFMSPECSVLEEFDGFKADMYSLGILLFCMLYGFQPYTLSTVMKFREFYLKKKSKTLGLTSAGAFIEHLDSISELTEADIAYSLIISGEPEELFELFGISKLVSPEAQRIVCSLLKCEDERACLSTLLSHPWTANEYNFSHFK
jgi:serine/threonine protein kinase